MVDANDANDVDATYITDVADTSADGTADMVHQYADSEVMGVNALLQ